MSQTHAASPRALESAISGVYSLPGGGPRRAPNPPEPSRVLPEWRLESSKRGGGRALCVLCVCVLCVVCAVGVVCVVCVVCVLCVVCIVCACVLCVRVCVFCVCVVRVWGVGWVGCACECQNNVLYIFVRSPRGFFLAGILNTLFIS